MKKTELEDICRMTVRFSEIDSMQRAWHGSFVTYLEDGRESFGRHYPGIGYADMSRAGIYAAIYDLRIRYLAPLALDDVARIHTRYVYHPGARIDFLYEIYRERDNRLCAKANTTQLFVDTEGILLVDIPDFFKEWQDKHLGDAPQP